MIYFPPPEDVLKYAWDLSGTVDFPEEYYKSNRRKKFYGILGECSVCRYLGLPMPKFEKPNGGFDIYLNEKRIDVKSKGVKGMGLFSYFEHFVLDHQIHYPADFYLFTYVRLHPDPEKYGSKDGRLPPAIPEDFQYPENDWKVYDVVFLGMIRKKDFLDLSRFVEKGSMEMGTKEKPRIAEYSSHQIKLKHLTNIDDKSDIYKQIDDLKYDEYLQNQKSRQDPITLAQEEKFEQSQGEDWEDKMMGD